MSYLQHLRRIAIAGVLTMLSSSDTVIAQSSETARDTTPLAVGGLMLLECTYPEMIASVLRQQQLFGYDSASKLAKRYTIENDVNGRTPCHVLNLKGLPGVTISVISFVKLYTLCFPDQVTGKRLDVRMLVLEVASPRPAASVYVVVPQVIVPRRMIRRYGPGIIVDDTGSCDTTAL